MDKVCIYYLAFVVCLAKYVELADKRGVFQGYEYLRYDNKSSFNASRSACQALNANLAKVNNSDLNEWMKNELLPNTSSLSENDKNCKPETVTIQFWIGLTLFNGLACGESCRKNWTWEDGSLADTYSDWIGVEPEKGERILRMSGCKTTNYRWAGQPRNTTDKYGYICFKDYDECRDDVTCQNSGSCTNLPGAYKCTCETGWSGRNCSEDINECTDMNDNQTICGFHGNCINLNGTYKCTCEETHEGVHCEKAKSQPINSLFYPVAVLTLTACVLVIVDITLCICNRKLEKSKSEKKRPEIKHLMQPSIKHEDEAAELYVNFPCK